jgi:hypothetical protein
MTDPKRLLDDEPEGFEAELLRAGRGEAPSSAAREASAVAGGLAVAGTVAPRAAAASGTKAVLVAAAKGMVLGALVTTGAVTAAHFAGRSEPAVEQRTEAMAETPTPVLPSSPALAALEEQPPPAVSAPPSPSAAPTEPEPTTQVADSKSRVADEILAFEKAQKAFSHGNVWAASAALDEYDREFPHGTLAMEAEVLHIELLKGRGNTAAMRARARAFLDANPTAPDARHIKNLLDQTKTASPP